MPIACVAEAQADEVTKQGPCAPVAIETQEAEAETMARTTVPGWHFGLFSR
jgi:hypothetical protein